MNPNLPLLSLSSSAGLFTSHFPSRDTNHSLIGIPFLSSYSNVVPIRPLVTCVCEILIQHTFKSPLIICIRKLAIEHQHRNRTSTAQFRIRPLICGTYFRLYSRSFFDFTWTLLVSGQGGTFASEEETRIDQQSARIFFCGAGKILILFWITKWPPFHTLPGLAWAHVSCSAATTKVQNPERAVL